MACGATHAELAGGPAGAGAARLRCYAPTHSQRLPPLPHIPLPHAGSVLIEQVLRELRPTKIVLVTRTKKGVPGLERVAKLLSRPLFDAVREQYGGAEALLQRCGEAAWRARACGSRRRGMRGRAAAGGGSGGGAAPAACRGSSCHCCLPCPALPLA